MEKPRLHLDPFVLALHAAEDALGNFLAAGPTSPELAPLAAKVHMAKMQLSELCSPGARRSLRTFSIESDESESIGSPVFEGRRLDFSGKDHDVDLASAKDLLSDVRLAIHTLEGTPSTPAVAARVFAPGTDFPKPRRFCVTDDEPAVRRVAGRVLAGSVDETILMASNIDELYTHLESDDPPDVVTVDDTMPGVKGSEAIAGLRKKFPEVTFIFVTASSDYEARFFDMGFDGFILKQGPLNKDLYNSCLYEVYQRLSSSSEPLDHRTWIKNTRK